MPKPSVLTYNRYAAIAGRVLRRALSDEAKTAASAQDQFEVRLSKWDNGKVTDVKYLEVPFKK
ncbi:hypothetical protein DASB73_023880 [Starmerella bacillaris]|uniref:Uncharacterized protein n=1 Tax=Starmerella bacillaris TaxID=1247836 RepID=A0AAV5RIU2_STABA|nr:hypothetical protein DASB73_023880 [Starmerella bacillaris]